jgi:manganese transport protein
MFLQYLALKVGLATGRDIAGLMRDEFSDKACKMLWAVSEVGMVACSLAEILGAALAIQLLFGLAQPAAVCVAAINMVLLLQLQERGLRKLEALVASMVLLTAICLAVELALSRPGLEAIAAGLLSNPAKSSGSIYLAAGILGATIMPHNLYLQSSLAKSGEGFGSRRSALRSQTIGTVSTLLLAAAVNSGLLILAAAAYHRSGSSIELNLLQAYKLMPAALGVGFASILFGFALWLASQSAAVTSAMAGEIVLKGFGVVKTSPRNLRAISRVAATVPALLAACWFGEAGSTKLLVLSQVALSFQLPFVAIPLLRLTSKKEVMADLANDQASRVAGWTIMALIFASDAALAGSIL